jgi:hypothetical protein
MKPEQNKRTIKPTFADRARECLNRFCDGVDWWVSVDTSSKYLPCPACGYPCEMLRKWRRN